MLEVYIHIRKLASDHHLQVTDDAVNVSLGCRAAPVGCFGGELNEYGLHGSELLDDNPAVKRNDLGMLAEPLKGLKFAVGIVPADFIETVGFGGLKRGRVLRPFAANPDGIEFNLGVGVFLESFEVLEKSAAGGNGELRFAATSAE